MSRSRRGNASSPHDVDVARAREQYLESKTPVVQAQAWRIALADACRSIIRAIAASNALLSVGDAIKADGQHMLVFRHLFAPPISQDQFKLICPTWSKSSEAEGKRVSPAVASVIAELFDSWRDRALTPWLDENRSPSAEELRRLADSIAPLIANQKIGTLERNRLSAIQEGAVVNLLLGKGWIKVPSRLIDTRALLEPMQFMQKTRFATRSRPQEVDIACGLRETYVLAMECKVTNDETNSVKRINDILKKASQWRDHWGSFVKSAALLQGVVAAKDVERLDTAGVLVFWSHNLASFEAWLDSQFQHSS